jgi:hypothetical protein
VLMLGERCTGCKITVKSVLHPRPKTDWARRWRGAGKGKRCSTLVRTLLEMGQEEARKHFSLECANCEIRRKHGKDRCPR